MVDFLTQTGIGRQILGTGPVRAAAVITRRTERSQLWVMINAMIVARAAPTIATPPRAIKIQLRAIAPRCSANDRSWSSTRCPLGSPIPIGNVPTMMSRPPTPEDEKVGVSVRPICAHVNVGGKPRPS
jgi:hypothetical protein